MLAAALQAGFRESGALNIVPSSAGSDVITPVVGVRSTGLALESIVGVHTDGISKALVPEWQLQALVEFGNQRFLENTRRIARFRELLKNGLRIGSGDTTRRKGQNGEDWEDKDARRARKAEEGRRRAEEVRRAREQQASSETYNELYTGPVDL